MGENEKINSQETEPEEVICQSCGATNSPYAYFCSKCGIGLELMLPPGSDRLVNVDVAKLFKASVIGGVIGVLLTLITSRIGAYFAARTNWSVDSSFSILFSVFVWRVGPALFALGSSVSMYIKARKLGYVGSFWRTLFGSILALLATFLVAAWSGKLGFLALFLLSPFLAARFGFGFMTPWWPARKIALYGLGLTVISVGIIFGTKQIKMQRAISQTKITSMAFIPYDSDRLLIGTGAGELHQYNIGEQNWQQDSPISFPAPLSDLLSMDAEHQLVATSGAGLYRLSLADKGTILEDTNCSFIIGLRLCKDNQSPKIMAATEKGIIYKPLFSAVPWRFLGSKAQGTNHDPDLPDLIPSAFEVDEYDCSHILLGVFGLGILESKDMGLTYARPRIQGLVSKISVVSELNMTFIASGAGLYHRSGDTLQPRLFQHPMLSLPIQGFLVLPRQRTILISLAAETFRKRKITRRFDSDNFTFRIFKDKNVMIRHPVHPDMIALGGDKELLVSLDSGTSFSVIQP